MKKYQINMSWTKLRSNLYSFSYDKNFVGNCTACPLIFLLNYWYFGRFAIF